MRVFLDTNVLVSAFATRGLSTDVMTLVLREHELVLSEDVLSELDRILRTKLQLPDARASEIGDFLRTFTVMQRPATPSPYALRDPDDEPILAAAIEAQAHALVTGDRDLLDEAERIREIKVVSPRQFWEMVR